MKRNLERLIIILVFIARLIFILAVIALAVIVVSVLVTPVNADASPIEEPKEDDGRIPGDDIPATERCYMADEEIQEDFENYYIEQALLAKANKIENVKVSHYCCCVKCCGKDDGITYSGVKATPGVTVAVDTSIIPLGSDVLVDYGDGIINYYRADDTGSAIKGNELDLCVSSHQDAINLGVRTATVYWVEAD